MDSGLQIDNVQDFVGVIGNNVKPWRLLLGREVVHIDGRRGKIFLTNPHSSEIGVELKTREINKSKCKDSCTSKIYKAQVFNQIYPPICHQDLFNIIQEENEEIIRRKQKDLSLENQSLEQQELELDTGSNLLVDNVQRFAKIIGNNYNLWNLLYEKEVSHFNEEVKYKLTYKHNLLEEKEVKHYFKGKVCAVYTQKISELLIEIDYGGQYYVKYGKDLFICKFYKIFPPFRLEEIIDLVQKEQEKRKLEAEKIKEIERQEAEIKKIQRQEAKRRETQGQKVEKQKQEAKKQALLKSLREKFEQDFLNANNFYQTECTKHISYKEYQAEKSNYVQSWIQQHLNSNADFEQAAAIGAVENHVQVVARAGSGKTSTLVNRALFLQKHCGVTPDEMLLLAFNRKAAEEMRERLTSKLKDSIPHVMTFHALAYALVHPEETILFDEPDGEQGKIAVQDNIINEYIRNKSLDPVFHEEIRTLMMAHFREDWERIVLN